MAPTNRFQGPVTTGILKTTPHLKVESIKAANYKTEGHRCYGNWDPNHDMIDSLQKGPRKQAAKTMKEDREEQKSVQSSVPK